MALEDRVQGMAVVAEGMAVVVQGMVVEDWDKEKNP
jgi:hypothetical protein